MRGVVNRWYRSFLAQHTEVAEESPWMVDGRAGTGWQALGLARRPTTIRCASGASRHHFQSHPVGGLSSRVETGSFWTMSTLTEIEKAAAMLPADEQATLLHHLSQTLARRAGVAASWPVPPPDVPTEELQRIHALIEAEFSQVNAEGR